MSFHAAGRSSAPPSVFPPLRRPSSVRRHLDRLLVHTFYGRTDRLVLSFLECAK